MADFETMAETYAYYEGHRDGAGEYARLSQNRADLIAALREQIAIWREGDMDSDVPDTWVFRHCAEQFESIINDYTGGKP